MTEDEEITANLIVLTIVLVFLLIFFGVNYANHLAEQQEDNQTHCIMNRGEYSEYYGSDVCYIDTINGKIRHIYDEY